MNRPIATISWLLMLLLMSLQVSAQDDKQRTLALVTASDIQFERLTPNAVRKLFLGIPVSSYDQPLTVLLNNNSDLLNEIFLQKVVYMSERHYERMLVSQTFRTGRPRPAKFSDHGKLVEALKSTPGSVSLMWQKDADKDEAIHVLQILWQGRH